MLLPQIIEIEEELQVKFAKCSNHGQLDNECLIGAGSGSPVSMAKRFKKNRLPARHGVLPAFEFLRE